MDLRVKRTYQSLVVAFTKLMEEKPYEAITVAELCDASMIRRTTFYKHFADKDEFFAFFVKSLRDEFTQRIQNLEQAMPTERCSYMLKQTTGFLSEHQQLTDNALKSARSAMIVGALGEVIRLDLLQMFSQSEQSTHDLNSRTNNNYSPEMLAAFISGGIVQMTLQWWYQGRPQALEDSMISTIMSLERVI